MTTETTNYTGWTITFSVSPEESDYGSETFAPEWDFEASIDHLGDVTRFAIEAAFPGATVYIERYPAGHALAKTHVTSPRGPHAEWDQAFAIADTVDAIRESTWANFTSWVIAA